MWDMSGFMCKCDTLLTVGIETCWDFSKSSRALWSTFSSSVSPNPSTKSQLSVTILSFPSIRTSAAVLWSDVLSNGHCFTSFVWVSSPLPRYWVLVITWVSGILFLKVGTSTWLRIRSSSSLSQPSKKSELSIPFSFIPVQAPSTFEAVSFCRSL